MKKFFTCEKGQGLVEYALILVLVAIVVIAVLLILGPQIGSIFSRVNTVLGGGTLISASTERHGGGHGNDVDITVTVIRATTVTVTDSQSGQTTDLSCSSTCSHTFTSIDDAGEITVTTLEGDSITVSYPAKLP
jgi:pilus assembly protein Flp/PilA